MLDVELLFGGRTGFGIGRDGQSMLAGGKRDGDEFEFARADVEEAGEVGSIERRAERGRIHDRIVVNHEREGLLFGGESDLRG